MIEFTKDELFFIEQEMDLKASIVGKNMFDLCTKFMLIEPATPIEKLMWKILAENNRTFDVIKSIRDKLEKERLGDTK